MRALLGLAIALCSVAALAQPGRAPRVSPQTEPIYRMYAALNVSGHLPACTTAAGCVLDCGVGVADGTAEWQCVDGDGVEVAVTQGTGTTYEDTPFVPSPGGVARQGMTLSGDAAAPKLTDRAELGNIWASEHTVVAYSHPVPGATGPMPMSNGQINVVGFYMQANSSSLGCNYSGGGTGQTATVASDPQSGWNVMSCRRDASNYTARVNGTETEVAIAVTADDPTSTHDLFFGRYSGANFWHQGPLSRVRIYTRALSDAELARIEAQWWGTLAGTRNVTTTRASTAWLEAADGYVYAYGAGAGRARDLGILSFEGRTNWFPNSTDASAQTLQGTPVITTGVLSGPFSRYAGAAECDDVEDDASGASEGFQSANANVSGAGDYTVSIYGKAEGALTTHRLAVFQAGGSGGGTCTFSGLDDLSTASCSGTGVTCSVQCHGGLCNAGFPLYPGDTARLVCTANVSGTTTQIVGQVFIGEGSAAVGTLRVCQAHFEKGGKVGVPIVCGASACSTTVDDSTVSTAGWPTGAGSIEVEYTPLAAPSNSALVDSRATTSTGPGVLLYFASGALRFHTYDGTSNTQTTTSATWTPGQTYRIRARWGNGNVFVYQDGVLIGSTTTGAAVMPTGHAASASLGLSVADVWPLNGYIRDLRVKR